jgi:hypothetical protein
VASRWHRVGSLSSASNPEADPGLADAGLAVWQALEV